mmetsp:Transcript_43384/g.90869  ORF Transcript_43384/g.90869 Transcript_43384/m.90869 type:complete len:150 (-) Transcript_43384:261-710(-)
MAQNKLSKELKNLQTEPVPQGEAGPKSDNLYEWEGIIRGPEGTAYEGGTFRFEMRFPAEYPFKPPKVNFLTKVLHPNITEEGKVCLDIVSDSWNPAVSIRQIILSLHTLLTDPNPSNPLRPEVAKLLSDDPAAFQEQVRQWVKDFASSP